MAGVERRQCNRETLLLVEEKTNSKQGPDSQGVTDSDAL